MRLYHILFPGMRRCAHLIGHFLVVDQVGWCLCRRTEKAHLPTGNGLSGHWNNCDHDSPRHGSICYYSQKLYWYAQIHDYGRSPRGHQVFRLKSHRPGDHSLRQRRNCLRSYNAINGHLCYLECVPDTVSVDSHLSSESLVIIGGSFRVRLRLLHDEACSHDDDRDAKA